MFKELVPILRHRAVLMTVTFIEEDQIRVNVVPKKLKDGENNALTTPVTVTGTAEELDAELGPTLVKFVGAHIQLKNTLESAKADMDAAAKAAGPIWRVHEAFDHLFEKMRDSYHGLLDRVLGDGRDHVDHARTPDPARADVSPCR